MQAWLAEARSLPRVLYTIHPQVSEVQERMEGLLRAHAAAYDRILEARQDPAVAAGNQTAQSYIVQKYGKAKAQNNGR